MAILHDLLRTSLPNMDRASLRRPFAVCICHAKRRELMWEVEQAVRWSDGFRQTGKLAKVRDVRVAGMLIGSIVGG